MTFIIQNTFWQVNILLMHEPLAKVFVTFRYLMANRIYNCNMFIVRSWLGIEPRMGIVLQEARMCVSD